MRSSLWIFPMRVRVPPLLAIHAHKRSVPLSPQEVLALAKRSVGFSGAELEQAIVAAFHAAGAHKSKPAKTTLFAGALRSNVR